MKLILAALIVATLFSLEGCGSGGLPGGGDQTITVSTSQDQDNNQTQTQNEPPLTCSDSCLFDASSGDYNQTRNCEGGAPFVIAGFATIGDCAAQVQTTETSVATEG